MQKELNAPREQGHADEQWSNSIPSFAAPPSGVTFAENGERFEAPAAAIRVANFRGKIVSTKWALPSASTSL